jgi:hypothetical protein
MSLITTRDFNEIFENLVDVVADCIYDTRDELYDILFPEIEGKDVAYEEDYKSDSCESCYSSDDSEIENKVKETRISIDKVLDGIKNKRNDNSNFFYRSINCPPPTSSEIYKDNIKKLDTEFSNKVLSLPLNMSLDDWNKLPEKEKKTYFTNKPNKEEEKKEEKKEEKTKEEIVAKEEVVAKEEKPKEEVVAVVAVAKEEINVNNMSVVVSKKGRKPKNNANFFVPSSVAQPKAKRSYKKKEKNE